MVKRVQPKSNRKESGHKDKADKKKTSTQVGFGYVNGEVDVDWAFNLNLGQLPQLIEQIKRYIAKHHPGVRNGTGSVVYDISEGDRLVEDNAVFVFESMVPKAEEEPKQ